MFLDWVEERKNPEGKDAGAFLHNDPLDTFTVESIGKVVEENSWRFGGDQNKTSAMCGEPSYDIFWASDTRENRLVSMQRIASVSGLCYMDEASNMAIHPQFGPWLSFRAVTLFHVVGNDIDREGDGAAQPLPKQVPNPLSNQEEMNARRFVEKAFDKNASKDSCAEFLIAARDSVVLGRHEHRFSDSQLMYHYTKDVRYLEGLHVM